MSSLADDRVVLGPAASWWWACGLSVLALLFCAHAVWMHRRGAAVSQPPSASYRMWAIIFAVTLVVLEVGILGKYWLILIVGDRIETEAIDESWKRTNNRGQIIETFGVSARSLDPDDDRVYSGDVSRELHDRVFHALHSFYRKGDLVDVREGDDWQPATIQEHYAEYLDDDTRMQRVLADGAKPEEARWVPESEIRLRPKLRSEELRMPFMVVPQWRALHQVGDTPGIDVPAGRIGIPLLAFFLLGIGYAVDRRG